MSFGFSIGDIVLLAQLAEGLIGRVRHAPAQFKEFEGDLKLACIVLGMLQESWPQFSQNATARGLSRNQSQILHGIIMGIQDTLDKFHTKLNSYNVGPSISSAVQNIQFTGQLQELKDRLAFHMSALHLVMEQMILKQGSTIIRTLGIIQEGQREEGQRMEQHGDEQLGDRTARNRNEPLRHATATHLSPRGYIWLHENSGPPDEILSTVSSRDYLIDRWRREVPFGLDLVAVTETVPIDDEDPKALASDELAPSPEVPGPKQPTPSTSLASLHDDKFDELVLAFAAMSLPVVPVAMIVSLVISGYLFGMEASNSSGWDAPKSNAFTALIVSCVQWAVVLLAGLAELYFRFLRLRLIGTALVVINVACRARVEAS